MVVALRVYEEKKEQPQLVEFFIENYNGGILLRAMGPGDTKDDCWSILKIDMKGKLTRCTSVARVLGLPTDDRGRIELSE